MMYLEKLGKGEDLVTKNCYEQWRHKSLLPVNLTVNWDRDFEEAVSRVVHHVAPRIAFRALGGLSRRRHQSPSRSLTKL